MKIKPSTTHEKKFLQTASENIEQYLRAIKTYPFLESEEEYQIACAWFQNQDLDAAHKLITSHLRLVVKIAMGYRGYGLPVSDLIAEGNIGVLNALKKFDPHKGYRFSTYATWWIKASVQEYILKTWSLVKIGTTAGQRKLFFNLKKLKNELSQMDGAEHSMTDEDIKHISERIEVGEDEVREMEQRMDRGGDASLNASLGSDDDIEWQDWVENQDPTQEDVAIEQDMTQKRHTVLTQCLLCLTPREIEILKSRRLKDPPDTLDKISKTMGISKERIRQIEEKAFSKLREEVHKEITKRGLDHD